MAHYLAGTVWYNEGISKKKDEMFSRAHEEMIKALGASPDLARAVLTDGRVLARLKQDDAARARFEQYVKMMPADDPDRQRALRYVDRPELARARMAPPFVVTTADGKRISMDDLQGRVVLLDFWATWCAPCRAALPHMKEIVKKFQGQPLVVLSVSLDSDEGSWREFISKNEMSWPQYIDGGFTGRIAQLFGVQAIPHTFTIDADGVLEEEHVGDASIEWKIKKLLAQVKESQSAPEDSH
jgi:peroxiredoxin